MQYLSCSRRWDYYRHILPLILTHDTIRGAHHQTETAAAVKKANCMLVIIKNSFAVLNIFTLLEYGNVIWGPQYKLDQQALEKVLRRATKLLPQLKDLDYMHRPKALKLSSLQYRKQRRNMIGTLKNYNWQGETGPYTILHLCQRHI